MAVKMTEVAMKEIVSLLDEECESKIVAMRLKNDDAAIHCYTAWLGRYNAFRKAVDSLCKIFGLSHEGLIEWWNLDNPFDMEPDVFASTFKAEA